MRGKFQIKDSVKAGVVIGKVDPETPAAEQHLAPGDVIVEVNRQPVATPEDVLAQAKALKADGRKIGAAAGRQCTGAGALCSAVGGLTDAFCRFRRCRGGDVLI